MNRNKDMKQMYKITNLVLCLKRVAILKDHRVNDSSSYIL